MGIFLIHDKLTYPRGPPLKWFVLPLPYTTFVIKDMVIRYWLQSISMYIAIELTSFKLRQNVDFQSRQVGTLTEYTVTWIHNSKMIQVSPNQCSKATCHLLIHGSLTQHVELIYSLYTYLHMWILLIHIGLVCQYATYGPMSTFDSWYNCRNWVMKIKDWSIQWNLSNSLQNWGICLRLI